MNKPSYQKLPWRDSKLIQLFHALSLKEKQQFSRFIRSPFFNEKKTLETLADYLSATPATELDKIAAFGAMFPGKAYNDIRFRQLAGELSQAILEFLSISKYQQQQLPLTNNTLQALLEHQQPVYFQQLFYEEENKSSLQEYEEYYFFSRFNRNQLFAQYKSRERTKESNLPEVLDSLDAFYFYHKLKHSCALLNYKNYFSISYQPLLLEELQARIEQLPSPHPGILIYHKILLTLQESENELHFEALKKLLQHYAHLFNPEEARTMFVYAQNYCIGKINKGNHRFLREVFSLYQLTLEKEIIFENNYLTPWSFKNIVITGLRLNEIAWVETFIHSYKTRLHPEHKKNAVTFNMARLYFFKKEYRQVIRLLRDVQYDDVFYGLDSRMILLKTYYELDEPEHLLSLIDSFKIFLKRNKSIASTTSLVYLNFVRFLKKLIARYRFEDKKLRLLHQEITATENIADKEWLLHKITELTDVSLITDSPRERTEEDES